MRDFTEFNKWDKLLLVPAVFLLLIASMLYSGGSVRGMLMMVFVAYFISPFNNLLQGWSKAGLSLFMFSVASFVGAHDAGEKDRQQFTEQIELNKKQKEVDKRRAAIRATHSQKKKPKQTAKPSNIIGSWSEDITNRVVTIKKKGSGYVFHEQYPDGSTERKMLHKMKDGKVIWSSTFEDGDGYYIIKEKNLVLIDEDNGMEMSVLLPVK